MNGDSNDMPLCSVHVATAIVSAVMGHIKSIDIGTVILKYCSNNVVWIATFCMTAKY